MQTCVALKLLYIEMQVLILLVHSITVVECVCLGHQRAQHVPGGRVGILFGVGFRCVLCYMAEVAFFVKWHGSMPRASEA